MSKNQVILKKLSYPLAINQFIRRRFKKILVMTMPHQSKHASMINQFAKKSIVKVLVLNKNKLLHVELKKSAVKNKEDVTKKKSQDKRVILVKKRRILILLILFAIMGSVAEKFIMFVESLFLIHYINLLTYFFHDNI